MSDTFIIADAHGNHGLIRGLLAQEGLLGERTATVGQLGDLANCVERSTYNDLEAIDLVQQGVIDWALVGNHEHPYFGGPMFSGYWRDPVIFQALRRLHVRGGLKAAHCVDDILISHAGLTPWGLGRFESLTTAQQYATAINELWLEDQDDLLFSRIGEKRGGWQKQGGILWADWSEPKPRNLRQLVGHTVGKEIRRRSGAICIDLGAGFGRTKIAGAWIRGGVIEVVTYEHEV